MSRTVKHGVVRHMLAVALLITGLSGFAASISIGGGNTVNLGSAQVNLGCADIMISGSLVLGANSSLTNARDVLIGSTGALNGGSGSLYVSGNWTNAGNFSAGTGRIILSDGCNRVSADLTGDSTFWSLALGTATGRQYNLATGSIQSIVNSLSIEGQAGNLLQLRSSVDCSPAYIDLQGSGTGAYFDVDCTAVLTRTFNAGDGAIIGQNATGFSIRDDDMLNILIIIRRALELQAM